MGEILKKEKADSLIDYTKIKKKFNQNTTSIITKVL